MYITYKTAPRNTHKLPHNGMEVYPYYHMKESYAWQDCNKVFLKYIFKYS